MPFGEIFFDSDSMQTSITIQYFDSPCGRMLLGAVGGRLCLCVWSESPRVLRNIRHLEQALGAKAVMPAELIDAGMAESPLHQAEPATVAQDSDSVRVIEQAGRQLCEYFERRRTAFELPLLPVGTAFQRRVWAALLTIPYGETRSYGDIARQVGNPRGVRAVAQAIGANGIGIIIPCHRVVGSDGSLTGFAGGLAAKRILLGLECRVV